MAKYSYKCLDCGGIFDIQATVQEKEGDGASKFACPECKSKRILPQFSPANFVKNIFISENKSGGCCSGQDDGSDKGKKGGCRG